MLPPKHREMTKVAVILYKKEGDRTTLFFGKNFHPLMKKQQIAAVKENLVASKFGLNFPAGKVNKSDSSLLESAARELCEETGGLFRSSLVNNPWPQDSKQFVEQINLDHEKLKPINHEPVTIKMFNHWNNEFLTIHNYFFSLENSEVSLRKLNFFCSSAFKKLRGNRLKTFREVIGFVAVPAQRFLERLQKIKEVHVDESWFLGTSPGDELLLFSDSSGKSFQFNKRYFFATSEILDLLSFIK